MGPVHAILTGLAKSFQFTGRTSRYEFWWFAPIGLAFPGLAVHWGFPSARDLLSALVLFLVVVVTAIPISAAAVRRFHDVDSSGGQFFAGIIPAIFVSFGILLTLVGLFGVVTIIYAVPGMTLIGVGATIVISTAFVGPGLLQTLRKLGSPSDPLPNRFGPPPSEVTP